MQLNRILTKDVLTRLYCFQKNSLGDIAKRHKCTRQYIYKLLKYYKIKRRSKSEARIEAIKKHKFSRFLYYEIDETFFDTWSPEMAWVLGLFFTDGCLCETKKGGDRLSFESIDFELIEKVKKAMKCSAAVRKCRQGYDKNRHIYRLDIFRVKILDSLRMIGLTNRKSLTMEFPIMPIEYQRHFIRGCWDGDGSIIEDRGRLRASYVSGSKRFLMQLVFILFDEGICRVVVNGKPLFAPARIYVSMKSKNPSYYIKINSKFSMINLYSYMYGCVDSSIYLSRKHAKFINGIRSWLTEG